MRRLRSKLEEIRRTLQADVQAVFDRDPAARSILEVILTTPGLHALWTYRVAHFFYGRRWFLLARIISQVSRFFNGIEIHPGAQIGKGLFIDHGMGVVIGETCKIGNDVTIYQGVTLGGTGKEKKKRHPTIEDHALIAPGAKLLGGIRIGRYAKVGAGSVVLQDVPAYATVVGVPGRAVMKNDIRIRTDLDQTHLPDPVAEMISLLQAEMVTLRHELEELKGNRRSDSEEEQGGCESHDNQTLQYHDPIQRGI